MLFGGALKAVGTAVKGEGDRLLSVDGWMKFKVKPAEVSLMIKVREELDALLRQKIAKPGLELTRQGQGVLAAVRVLLQREKGGGKVESEVALTFRHEFGVEVGEDEGRDSA